jgi:hypothetical protein
MTNRLKHDVGQLCVNDMLMMWHISFISHKGHM